MAGDVVRPGVYSNYDADLTVLAAIDCAGGEDPDADHQAMLIRQINAELEQIITFSSLRALRRSPEADIILRPQDQVIVQRRNGGAAAAP